MEPGHTAVATLLTSLGQLRLFRKRIEHRAGDNQGSTEMVVFEIAAESNRLHLSMSEARQLRDWLIEQNI